MNEEGFMVSAAPSVPQNKSGFRAIDIDRSQNS